jgi:hypothetical protein
MPGIFIRRNNMKDEVWKPIEEFDGTYMVSNMGHVKQSDKRIMYEDGRVETTEGQLLKPFVHDKTTPVVHFNFKGKRTTRSLARLVASHFIDNPKELRYVIFIDGDKENCRYDNLEWADTYTEKEK